MKILVGIFLVYTLWTVSSACAITVNAQVEGPLLIQQRVVDFVKQNLEGEIANTPDLQQGGKHRLFVRVASKHIGPGSWFLYFAEIQLQRRVLDAESNRIYWASIRSAVLWGTVPSESEVRQALTTLMAEKVRGWETD